MEGQVPGGQEERQGVGEQRRRANQEPRSLESPGPPTSETKSSNSGRNWSRQKTAPVEVIQPPQPLPVEFAAPLPRHQYSPGLIQLFLRGSLEARWPAMPGGRVGVGSPWLPGADETPCANTGRMWLLRLGLYELTRPKPRADNWLLIFDHTVQLYHWSVLLAIAETAENHVRYEGYHRAAADQLRERLDGWGDQRGRAGHGNGDTGVRGRAVARHGRGAADCSSEVLESLIGKYKDLQGKNSRGGMTPQLLAIGAVVMEKTTETIRRGLTAIRTCDVWRWCREHLGLSLQGQRTYAYKEQKQDIKLLPAPNSF